VDDRQLIQRIISGDPVAERQLYERHVERVFRLAYRMTGDATLAEDLTQDTFIRAFARLEGFRGEAAFSSWLHRVATSIIITALRKRSRIRAHEATHEDLANLGRAAPDRDRDLERQLGRAVAELDENHRLVLVMHDLEGYTHQEIAAAMDTPVGTAKARLSRARRRLREIMTGFGFDLSPDPS